MQKNCDFNCFFVMLVRGLRDVCRDGVRAAYNAVHYKNEKFGIVEGGMTFRQS